MGPSLSWQANWALRSPVREAAAARRGAPGLTAQAQVPIISRFPSPRERVPVRAKPQHRSTGTAPL